MDQSNEINLVGFLFLALATAQAERDAAIEQSLTNDRTGLPNNRAFMECLKAELERGIRHHHSLTAMMLDFDKFKVVNDLLTHLGADELLREFAVCAPTVLRASEKIFHISGDEFMFVLPEVTDSDCEVIKKRIGELLVMLSNSRKQELKDFVLSASFSKVCYDLSNDSKPTAEEICKILSKKNKEEKSQPSLVTTTWPTKITLQEWTRNPRPLFYFTLQNPLRCL